MAESVELATILLSDLVGSTRLATSVGPVRADELREEHFGLLRDAIAGCGGREVKNTGDGLMVAFSSPAHTVWTVPDLDAGLDSGSLAGGRFRVRPDRGGCVSVLWRSGRRARHDRTRTAQHVAARSYPPTADLQRGERPLAVVDGRRSRSGPVGRRRPVRPRAGRCIGR